VAWLPRAKNPLLAWPSRNAGNLRFSRARLARSACWLAWARNGDGITSDWARAWVTMAGARRRAPTPTRAPQLARTPQVRTRGRRRPPRQSYARATDSGLCGGEARTALTPPPRAGSWEGGGEWCCPGGSQEGGGERRRRRRATRPGGELRPSASSSPRRRAPSVSSGRLWSGTLGRPFPSLPPSSP
jgi:hypothetical protein